MSRTADLLLQIHMTNKKAVIDIGPVQLGGLILAVILIAGTVWFFARLSGIFTGGGEERATEVAFQTLAFKINELTSSQDQCAATQDGQNLFVAPDYAIVGFNDFAHELPITNCGNQQITRPIRPDCPKEKSCICLYKTQEVFKNLEPLQCAAINSEWIVMPLYSSSYLPTSVQKNMAGGRSLHSLLQNTETTFLFIFGQCDDWWIDENFGTKKMYLEKNKADRGTAVLIANYDSDMEKRYEDCTKQIKK